MSTTWAAGMHWAYSERAWCGFFAQDEHGLVVCRHELTWYQAVPEDAADDIVQAMKAWKIPQLQYLALDQRMFPAEETKKARVHTVSTTLSEYGLPVRRSHDDWSAAWVRVRSWLSPRKRADGTIQPTLRVHRACEYLVRTLPVVVSSSADKDIAEECEEVIPAKAVSYYVMARPLPRRDAPAGLPAGAIGHDVEEIRRQLRSGV